MVVDRQLCHVFWLIDQLIGDALSCVNCRIPISDRSSVMLIYCRLFTVTCKQSSRYQRTLKLFNISSHSPVADTQIWLRTSNLKWRNLAVLACTSSRQLSIILPLLMLIRNTMVRWWFITRKAETFIVRLEIFLLFYSEFYASCNYHLLVFCLLLSFALWLIVDFLTLATSKNLEAGGISNAGCFRSQSGTKRNSGCRCASEKIINR